MNPIFVYRTSVSGEAEVRRLQPVLNRLVNAGGRWNFDLEDSDNILRVESAGLPSAAIVNTLKGAGFECEELPD